MFGGCIDRDRGRERGLVYMCVSRWVKVLTWGGKFGRHAVNVTVRWIAMSVTERTR